MTCLLFEGLHRCPVHLALDVQANRNIRFSFIFLLFDLVLDANRSYQLRHWRLSVRLLLPLLLPHPLESESRAWLPCARCKINFLASIYLHLLAAGNHPNGTTCTSYLSFLDFGFTRPTNTISPPAWLCHLRACRSACRGEGPWFRLIPASM